MTQPIVHATTQALSRDAAHYRRIAEWGIQAAEALEHAHSLAIIHRDIKPANLMIDSAGSLWVTDFGLSRTAADSGLTMTGDVVGTLRYMSPEQALAKHGLVDHRTDIYSLGATLYELLTLRPVFDGQDREELLRQIVFEEPRPLRRIDPRIPAELETIVLKAMSKEPTGRYGRSQELADDLRCFLEHKPIRARRPTLVDRLAKWCRRHRPLVLAAAVFLLLALVGSTAALVLIVREQSETAHARDLALERERSLRRNLYVQDMRLAWQALRDGEEERMRGLLDRHIPEVGQEDLRGFEWHYLQRRSRGVLREAARVAAHKGDAYCVVYSPDGRTLASAGQDGRGRLWDSRTLERLGELRIEQWGVNEVVFTPDGKTLAGSGDDGTVRVWDIASATQRAKLHTEAPRTELSALALSPDGKTIAAGGSDGRIWSWNLASGALNAVRNPGAGAIHYLAISPDGRYLATANDASRVLLLDPATLQERGQLQHPHGKVECVCFSRDGRTLAVGSSWGGFILLWDLKGRILRSTLPGHNIVQSLSFSPEDTLLVSGGNDGRVKLWDIRSASLRASALEPTERIWSVAFAPNGKQLATAGRDGIVKLWNVHGEDRRTIRVAPEAKGGLTVWAAFAPDGQTLLTHTKKGDLRRWSVLTCQRVESMGEPAVSQARPALSPRGRLATVEDDGRTLRVQDLSGAAVQEYRHERAITAVAISADGEQIAFGDVLPAIWLWKVGSDRPRELVRPSHECSSLAFASDGSMVAVADDARALLVDTARGELLATLSRHTKLIASVAISPDGRQLATASYDGRVRIWDRQSGQERHCFWKHRKRVIALAYSPDGKTLASGGEEGKVMLWDTTGGEDLMTLDDHSGTIITLAFSPDGKILAAGGHGTNDTGADVTFWYGEGVSPEP